MSSRVEKYTEEKKKVLFPNASLKKHLPLTLSLWSPFSLDSVRCSNRCQSPQDSKVQAYDNGYYNTFRVLGQKMPPDSRRDGAPLSPQNMLSSWTKWRSHGPNSRWTPTVYNMDLPLISTVLPEFLLRCIIHMDPRELGTWCVSEATLDSLNPVLTTRRKGQNHQFHAWGRW